VDEEPEAVAVLGRHAQHVGDHPHGDVLGVRHRGVHLGGAIGEQLVEQLSARGAGGVFELVDGLGGERRQQDAPSVLVERGVGGDGRGVAHGRQVLRFEHRHDHALGAEALGVVGDGRHVLMTAREPHTAVRVAVGDRAPLAQVVPDHGSLLCVVVVGVVEVGGPVTDGLVHIGHSDPPGASLPVRSSGRDNTRYRGSVRPV
jgi:hypothetical protein